jgi:hypothetical protein
VQYDEYLRYERGSSHIFRFVQTRKGATGIDGDTKVSGACRALGVS